MALDKIRRYSDVEVTVEAIDEIDNGIKRWFKVADVLAERQAFIKQARAECDAERQKDIRTMQDDFRLWLEGKKKELKEALKMVDCYTEACSVVDSVLSCESKTLQTPETKGNATQSCSQEGKTEDLESKHIDFQISRQEKYFGACKTEKVLPPLVCRHEDSSPQSQEAPKQGKVKR